MPQKIVRCADGRTDGTDDGEEAAGLLAPKDGGDTAALRPFVPSFLPSFLPPSFPSFLPPSSVRCTHSWPTGHPSLEYQMTPERTFVSLSPERGALPPSLPPSLTHTLTRSLSSSLMQERTHHKTRALQTDRQTDRQTNRQWCPHLGSGYSIARQRACTSRLHETYS